MHEVAVATGFLLQHNGSRGNAIPVAHVADAQAQKIASAQLAVDAEIEQDEFPQPALQLQSNPDGPDLPQCEGCPLADQVPLVPCLVMMNLCRFRRDLLSVEGDSTVCRPPAPTSIEVKVADQYALVECTLR
jgi:hypothetical protein